jgi:hypothetical protein
MFQIIRLICHLSLSIYHLPFIIYTSVNLGTVSTEAMELEGKCVLVIQAEIRAQTTNNHS